MPIVIADVVFSTEGMIVISALVAALATAVGALFKMLMISHARELADMKEQRDSFREIGAEATDKLVLVSIEKAKRDGKTIIPALAAVVPEHNSPTTQKQQEAAELQTMRAKLTAATLQLGLPPRLASGEEENASPSSPPPAVVMAVEKKQQDATAGPLTVVVVTPDGAAPVTLQADAVTITVDAAALPVPTSGEEKKP